MLINRFTSPWLGGKQRPSAAASINFASPQAAGLYFCAPLFEHQESKKPKWYNEVVGGGYGVVFDGGGSFASSVEPETGFYLPLFPGTGNGNSTHLIGFSNQQSAPNSFFSGSSARYQYNPSEMSWSIWFKAVSINSTYNLLWTERAQGESDPYTNWTTGYTSAGALEVAVSGGSAGTEFGVTSANGLVATGVWHHAVGTYDGKTLNGYLDGKLVATTTGSVRMGNYASVLRMIGSTAQQLFASYCVNAYVMDARLYYGALGLSRVQRLYEERWGLWQPARIIGRSYAASAPGNATDALSFTNSATASVARVGAVTDNLTFTSSGSAGRTISVSASDSLAMTGGGHDQNVPQATTDALVVTDTANKLQRWSVSVIDTLTLSDPSRGYGNPLRLQVTDTVIFSDLAPQGGVYLKSVTDTLSFTDRGTGFNGYVPVSASDGLAFSDRSSPYPTFNYPAAAIDNVFFTSSATGGRVYRAGVVDSVTFGDRFLTNGPYYSTLIFTDAATGIVPGQRVYDRLSVTDRADAIARVAGAGDKLGVVLASGLSGRYPMWYCQAPNGTILISNGVDAMLKWDGLTKPVVTAGVVAPTNAVVLSGSGSGSITGSYTGYVRFVDDLGNFSNLSPVSDEVKVTAVQAINYSSVATSSDPRIVRRQLLRNTNGQADTYYVDIDTTDLTSTTFSSTLTDAVLSTNDPVPILDSDNRPFANRFGIPPSSKAVVESHLGRMFAAVDVDVRDGNVQVVYGSAQVRGIGTTWPSTLAGRNLWVVGAPDFYQIQSVDVDAQVLTLYDTYQGHTDLFASYAIRPNADEADFVFYSEAGLPEAWPPVNAFGTQKDGDRITAIVTFSSFLYIFKTRRVYRYSYQSDPAKDGFVFASARRGAVNRRCIAEVDGTLYCLDESGIHAFTGDEEPEPISNPIQPLFQDGIGEFAINWLADRTYWHAAVNPLQETIRWFVSLSGNALPRHAIAYNYRQQRWWLEEYESVITSSSVGTLGFRRSFAGTEARRVIALAEGTLDGVPQVGTLRGSVTSATANSLTDVLANFSTTGPVGGSVAIVNGRGRGQQRRIVAATANTLRLQTPWSVTPDTTSVYQLGAIEYEWASGWFRFLENPEFNHRNVELSFAVLSRPGNAMVEFYYDHQTTPRTWAYSRQEDQVTVVAGDSAIEFEMGEGLGYVILQMGAHREQNTLGDRFVSIVMTGWQAEEAHRIFGLRIDGVEGLE